MNDLIETLREKNRTILEMFLGVFALGAVMQVISLFFSEGRWERFESLLLGTLLACFSILHMYRTLDRALDYDPGNAQKAVYRGYLFRYCLLAAVILGSIGLKIFNPLLIFLSYMSLKGTVYLQPFTHKFCNFLFHESDPEPQPMPEEDEERPPADCVTQPMARDREE